MSIFHRHLSLRKIRTVKGVSSADWQEDAESRVDEAEEVGTTINRSDSSSSTVYRRSSDDTTSLSEGLPSVSWSQASTVGMVHQEGTLNRKPSSPLLGKSFQSYSDGQELSKHRQLKEYGSSSTLHSHYDSRSAPLAISQQTSESSARDLALRKGMPIVVGPLSDESQGSRKLRESPSIQTSLSKRKLKPSAVDLSTLFPRPGQVRRLPGSRTPRTPLGPSRNSTRSVNQSNRSTPTIRAQIPGSTPSNLQEPSHGLGWPLKLKSQHNEPSHPKLHARRPQTRVKNWFDELDDDSDEEETTHEPELQHDFFDGIESAFRKGEIQPPTATESERNVGAMSRTFLYSPTTQLSADHSLRIQSPIASETSSVTPRLNLTLSETKQNSTGPSPFSTNRRPQRQIKPKRMDLANLQKESILCLSDSEEEQDHPQSRDSRVPSTVIRDSVAIDAIDEAEIEIGTAKAVSKHAMATQQAPQIKRVKSVGRARVKNDSTSKIPTRQSSKMFSYLNDDSSDLSKDQNAASGSSLASETESDGRASESIRSSLFTDPESTRLMTVTRQEELLLAAMRAKKANMGSDIVRDIRRPSSENSSKLSFKLHHPIPRNLQTGISLAEQLDRDLRRTSNTSGSIRFRDLNGIQEYYRRSGVFSRASGTTILSNGVSATTFQTTTPQQLEDTYSVSASDALDVPGTPQMTDRDLFSQHSTSRPPSQLTGSSRREYHHSRRRTDSGQIIVLDGLDDAPKREVRSQDFIEWPYSGWSSQAGLALVH